MNMQMTLLEKEAVPERLAHGSLVELPVAYSEGMERADLEAILTTAVIPLYVTWPKRDLGDIKGLVDLYQRRKPGLIGELHAYALVKIEEKWVLHATIQYLAGDLVEHRHLSSIELLVNSIDIDPNDRSKGRKLIGFSKALVHPRPDAVIGFTQV